MTVTVLGQEYPVELPRSWAEREDLVKHFGTGVHAGILYAALLGRCTRIGRLAEIAAQEAKVGWPSYERYREILAYGDAVYSYLRGAGLSGEQVRELGLPLRRAVEESVFPAEDVERRTKDFPKGPASSI